MNANPVQNIRTVLIRAFLKGLDEVEAAWSRDGLGERVSSGSIEVVLRDENGAEVVCKPTYVSRVGAEPYMTACAQSYGAEHESVLATEPVEWDGRLPKIPLQVSKLRWVDGKATFEPVEPPDLRAVAADFRKQYERDLEEDSDEIATLNERWSVVDAGLTDGEGKLVK